MLATYSDAVTTGGVRSTEIASLSTERIDAMDDATLAEIVKDAGLPFLRTPDLQRLPFMDRPTLTRLAFLARQYCRHAWRQGRGSALSD